jgi:hypothetical protein
VKAQLIQESLDGAFTLFKRSLFKYILDGAFTAFKRSLSYWAYPKPFKNISGAFQLLSV